MWELGEYAIQKHQAIVDQLKACNFNKVILVGALFGKIELPSSFCILMIIKKPKNGLIIAEPKMLLFY